MKDIKEDIEDLLYDSELDLNQIIDLKKNIKKYNFSLEDIEYLEELLNDELDSINELEELENLKKLFIEERFDISYIDKLIKRKGPISNDEIDLLNKEDLEYYINDDGSSCLDLDGLLRVKYNSNKYNYTDFDIEILDDNINEMIEEIKDINELEKYKIIMKNYGFSTSFIDKRIYNKKNGIIEELDDPLLISLNDYIASMPMEVLEKVRKDEAANNEGTEIIDRAIITKKQNGGLQKLQKKEESKSRRKVGLLGLLSGLFFSNTNNKSSVITDGLMPWEEDLVNKGEYEPHQFEEEELEEDDYYFEDDD